MIQAWQLETQTYPERLQEWELAKAQRENALAKLRLERLAVGDKNWICHRKKSFYHRILARLPERPSPNAPPAPPMYRRAREEDDDDVHIYAHMLQMKKLEFEKRCQEMPETRMVFEFHIQDHRQKQGPKGAEYAGHIRAGSTDRRLQFRPMCNARYCNNNRNHNKEVVQSMIMKGGDCREVNDP